jgi:hypothetical protein
VPYKYNLGTAMHCLRIPKSSTAPWAEKQTSLSHTKSWREPVKRIQVAWVLRMAFRSRVGGVCLAPLLIVSWGNGELLNSRWPSDIINWKGCQYQTDLTR